MKKQDKIVTVHQIDSIYLGQLNTSFQKNGIGILQTFSFDTYVGSFKNNKAEGLGLIVLANQIIIYAEFNRECIDGLTIIDNKQILQCGINRQGQMIGVGLQYHYNMKTWKMQRYHQGVPIQVIKQEVSDITVSLPKLINIQQSLFFHLYNYLQNDFFPDQKIKFIHQPTPNSLFLCYINNEIINGPGIKIINNNITEVGFYQNSQIHGFGVKKDFNEQYYCIGKFDKGRKDGIFYEQSEGHPKSYEYHKGSLIRSLQKIDNDIEPKQKKFNFNQKTFFSCKNTIPFDKLKQSLSKHSKNQNNSLLKNTKDETKNLKKREQQKIKKSSLNQFRHKQSEYIIKQAREKSSLQIMKEKINNYMKNGSSDKKSRKRGNSNQKEQSNNKQDDGIAEEENPFI